jgi:hypothetical protein
LTNGSSKIRILILGEVYHAKAFYEQLKNYEKGIFEPKYYDKLPSDEVLKNFDLYHLISSPLPVINKLKQHSKPILYHWIGTDVYRFLNDNFIKRYLKKLIIDSAKIHHLVVSPNLKDKLERFNINSRVVPLTKHRVVHDILQAQKKLSVLSYVPNNRWEFYHGETILELSTRLPGVDFHILAAGSQNSGKPNLFFYDFVEDVTSFYKKCSVLIRLTVHDGLPKMVLEALSYGMQVLWNEPFPHCYMVKNLNDCLSVLREFESDCPTNLEGKKFVDESFNESRILGDYYQMCKEIIR